jgi:hypothetical protein
MRLSQSGWPQASPTGAWGCPVGRGPFLDAALRGSDPLPDQGERKATEEHMGLEIVFFIGAFALLVALIYGVLASHYRDRTGDHVAEEIVRERYRKDET